MLCDRVNASKMISKALLAVLVSAAFVTAAHAEPPREFQVRRTAKNVPYGVIGDPAKLKGPAPTLLIFAHGLDVMRQQPVYTEVATLLESKGWISIIVEPPCHGEDARADEPAQLAGWRHRAEQNEPFIAAFCAKASEVLDTLVDEKITDPDRVAVCGTSRGGFLAYHFAASDPRIKATAGISPVTRLRALREFTTIEPADKADQLDVAKVASKLVGRGVWLSIGNHDLRVSTDDAIAFTRAVVEASARVDQPDAVIPVELIVAAAPGHSKIDQAHQRLADWLVAQLAPAK
ncbi:alpha/beta hydrolase family protein [Schlesneria paludicola]|uniref:alpha/beta hydrolase family protein n=1 Tax=Schlesneria paludicola TaxID=360056 RepID=UPI0012FA34FD|nr:prolyl oligopeptidase family serine peptidase [Schlesneria paludicola]